MWLSVLALLLILIGYFTILLYLLRIFAIESEDKNEEPRIFAITASTDLCLRAFLKMAPDGTFRSCTYKIMLFLTLICGFITFSYYISIFESALIVESKVLPFESWDDVAKSNKLVFVLRDSIIEDMFINAPFDHPMSKIYHEKIKVIPKDLSLNAIGEKGTRPYILNEEYIAFASAESFKELEEFPCKIKTLESVDELT